MRRLSSPAQPWVMSISEASFHFQHVPGLLLKGGLLLGFYVAAGIKKNGFTLDLVTFEDNDIHSHQHMLWFIFSLCLPPLSIMHSVTHSLSPSNRLNLNHTQIHLMAQWKRIIIMMGWGKIAGSNCFHHPSPHTSSPPTMKSWGLMVPHTFHQTILAIHRWDGGKQKKTSN